MEAAIQGVEKTMGTRDLNRYLRSGRETETDVHGLGQFLL